MSAQRAFRLLVGERKGKGTALTGVNHLLCEHWVARRQRNLRELVGIREEQPPVASIQRRTKGPQHLELGCRTIGKAVLLALGQVPTRDVMEDEVADEGIALRQRPVQLLHAALDRAELHALRQHGRDLHREAVT